MDNLDSLVDEWLWLDERAIFQAVSKNIALHMEEGLDRPLWEDDDDNWALFSDSSDCPSAFTRWALFSDSSDYPSAFTRS